MAVDNSFFIKKFQKSESMIVAYCAYTNMPFVVCDPESFNDQIFIFENEKLLQDFAKPYTEKKILLRGMKYQNADYLRFFGSLYTMGINELVFVNESGNTNIELTSLVNRPDYSKLAPEKKPVINESLQLTGIYFMQEAARPVPNEQKEGLKDLEEELAANLAKAKYIVPIILADGPETPQEKIQQKKYSIPVLKAKNEDVLQPLFTDPLELQKFTKGKPMGAITIGFEALSKLLVKDAKGYMLNPAGFHILMPRELLQGLSGRFNNPSSTPAKEQ